MSSDYFDDDPEFVKALAEVPLPSGDAAALDIPTSQDEYELGSDGMPPSTQPCLKRRRTPESEEEPDDTRATSHNILRSVDQDTTKSAYLTSHTYGASRFGEFGEYMQRKRQKLQIQNAEIDDDNDAPEQSSSRIFRGLQIYVSLSTCLRIAPTSPFVDQRMDRAFRARATPVDHQARRYLPCLSGQEEPSVSHIRPLYVSLPHFLP